MVLPGGYGATACDTSWELQCYGMGHVGCGTEIAYGTTACVCGTATTYGTTVSGTETAYGATICEIEIASGATGMVLGASAAPNSAATSPH
eukprot:2058049-Rhodomonas_salina.1